MNNRYCENWERIKERFIAWWRHEPIGYPLMRIVAAGKSAHDITPVEAFDNAEDMHLNAAKIVENYRNYCKTHWFLEDSYPAVNIDIGPGSMALYLGSEPGFANDTVWFGECIDNWDTFPGIVYDPQNRWWVRHLDMVRTAKALAGDDFLINIPDLMENLDIISALRGPQNLCYDLLDCPEVIAKAVGKVDELFFTYYDAMYDIVKGADGSSSFTHFYVWGPGKTAKIQCDFSALMSPGQFREFVLPSLRGQCKKLDNSVYHLDGPDAIKHVPALMEIDKLNALQWTCGAGQPDGGCERWHPIYDQVRAADKALWVHFYDGNAKDWVESGKRLIKRYGPDSLYFIFPEFDSREAAMGAAQAIRDASRL